MSPNEVFALECIARYAREGLDVKEGGVHDGYPDEFAHCPKPRPKGQKWRLAGDLGYWLTFYDHQKQGLLQSVDEGRKCYFTQEVYVYLNTMPPGHEELRVIYDEFNKIPEDQKRGHSQRMSGKFGALNHSSRAIVVIKPDGTEQHFGSGREAARELGMAEGNLCRYLQDNHVLTQGPRKGYQFFYAVKE